MDAAEILLILQKMRCQPINPGYAQTLIHDDVCSFFNTTPDKLVRQFISKESDNKLLFIRGDYEVNEAC